MSEIRVIVVSLEEAYDGTIAERHGLFVIILP
jgi:hypothetical protein